MIAHLRSQGGNDVTPCRLHEEPALGIHEQSLNQSKAMSLFDTSVPSPPSKLHIRCTMHECGCKRYNAIADMLRYCRSSQELERGIATATREPECTMHARRLAAGYQSLCSATDMAGGGRGGAQGAVTDTSEGHQQSPLELCQGTPDVVEPRTFWPCGRV